MQLHTSYVPIQWMNIFNPINWIAQLTRIRRLISGLWHKLISNNKQYQNIYAFYPQGKQTELDMPTN